ncbi:MAG: large conductance mechanosensitive channel protein MscL [Oscillospiraceae bacterium]|nr:large conductance mechanosensitive channel protein MscL [Oscillospiraceae bacterium]
MSKREKAGKFIEEFKAFALKGNMVDMAIGMIIGTAFSGLVSGLVKNIFTPALSIFTGKIDFQNLFYAMDGNTYPTLEEAQAATSVIAYGAFIQALIEFVILAFVVFLMVKFLAKLAGIGKKKEEEPAPAAPTTKVCPFCKSEIAIDATRCPHCTSELKD